MNQPVESHPNGEENKEMQKLKMLVQSLKKKYGDAVGEAYNLEAKCRRLTEENQTLTQTQNALTQKFNQTLVELQSLQESQGKLTQEHASAYKEAQESQEEIKALSNQHAFLISTLKSHEEEAKKAQDELQAVKLKETQLERVIQFLRKRAEEAHLETNHLTQELSQAQEQVATLTKELHDARQEVQLLRDKITQLENSHQYEKEELKALQEQLNSLSIAFRDKNDTCQKLDETCESLKRALQEENERYETLFKEHLFLKQSMMRSVEEVKEELEREKSRFDAALKVAHDEASTKETAFLATQKCLEEEIALLKEREQEAARIWSMKAAFDQEKLELDQEIAGLREQMALAKADHDETSQRFKMAQQHLAKKVRETALANEKIETERLKSLEMQNRLNLAEIKIVELKNSLEMEAEHQKRALARESELLKAAEAELARLETKYFDIHEKWREAETEIKELKKVEEKWLEAEKLFSKIGPFAAMAKEPPRPRDPIETSLPISTLPKEEPAIREIRREQSSLFEESKSAPRFKENFL